MPTAYTSQVTSYTDTTAQVRCIEDLIHNVSPEAVPLTKLIGINSIKNPPVQSTTYEWLEDTLSPTSSTCDTISTTTTTTVTLSTTTDSTFFRVGHVIEIGSELMWVSASDYAGNLTVTRGFASTTPATASTGSTVSIVGVAMIEGADASTGFKMDVSTNYNYCQIFQDVVQVSGTQSKMKQYGIKSEPDYQMAIKFKDQAILLERALFHGYRAAGSATTPRAMGGIPQYVTDNVTAASSAALTEKLLVDAMQNCFDDVGQEYMPKLVVCNGWMHRKIAEFYRNNSRSDRAERVGGVWINRIDTQFGQLDVMLNKWCPTDEVWLLNTDLISIGPLEGRAFFKMDLALSGDYSKQQLVGEYTCKFPADKAHGGITGLSTTT